VYLAGCLVGWTAPPGWRQRWRQREFHLTVAQRISRPRSKCRLIETFSLYKRRVRLLPSYTDSIVVCRTAAATTTTTTSVIIVIIIIIIIIIIRIYVGCSCIDLVVCVVEVYSYSTLVRWNRQ
jgi:hypothetical protein